MMADDSWDRDRVEPLFRHQAGVRASAPAGLQRTLRGLSNRPTAEATSRWPDGHSPLRFLLRESLDPIGWHWYHALPPGFRPTELARRHPHVVNRLGLLWDDADALAGYFRDLLLTQRQHRCGFASSVLAELMHLQAFAMGDA